MKLGTVLPYNSILLLREHTLGSGRTTRLMEQVPLNGVFIWCGQNVNMAKEIEYKIGRNDIKILPVNVLANLQVFYGMARKSVILDHDINRHDPNYFEVFKWLFSSDRLAPVEVL